VSVDVHFRKLLMFEPFSELLEVFGTHFIHLRLVTFNYQLMHSIDTVIDVKICVV